TDVLNTAPDSVAGGVTSRTLRVLALLFAATSSIVAAEAVCRVIDNFQLASMFLRPREQDRLASVDGKPDSPYVSAVRLADSVRPEWYAGRPTPIPRITLSTELKRRADRYGA